MNDELEQLRAENDRLIHDIQAPDGYSWEWHCARKDEEIERLRAALEDCQNMESKTVEELRAKIERLREHHKIAVDGWTLEAQNVKQLEDEAHEMKAEIERLRAAIDRAERTASLTAAASSVAGEAVRKMREAETEIERLREECLTRHADQRAKAEEIERLRGLLREAVTNDLENEWYERVREALGDE
jgi:predicted RNase H-like nuclease (RuvC/YqgF family)